MLRRADASGPPGVVVVGISTGGPATLPQMLKAMGGGLRCPMVVAQHMPPMFTSGFASHLRHETGLDVVESTESLELKPGMVVIAKGGTDVVVAPEYVRRPLVEATLRRIGTGTWRYVINNAQPFILPLTHHDRSNRSRGLDELLPTITSANRGELAMVAPTLVQTGYGERQGQAPRCLDIEAPLGTMVGGGQKHALVAAFLAKHYGGGPNGNQSGGAQGAVRPMGTITSQDHHALVASSLVKLKGTCADGQPVTVPLGTVAAQGTHFAEVRAFLIKYYGSDQDPRLEEPLHTITSKDRFGLVTVHGEEYVIADIGMRMLVARELFTAQGFPQSYIIDPVVDGKPLGKTEQVEKVGNSVCPPLAAAIVRANFADVAAARVAL